MKKAALLLLAGSLFSLGGCYYDRAHHDRDGGRYDAEREHDRQRMRDRDAGRDDRGTYRDDRYDRGEPRRY